MEKQEPLPESVNETHWLTRNVCAVLGAYTPPLIIKQTNGISRPGLEIAKMDVGAIERTNVIDSEKNIILLTTEQRLQLFEIAINTRMKTNPIEIEMRIKTYNPLVEAAIRVLLEKEKDILQRVA